VTDQLSDSALSPTAGIIRVGLGTDIHRTVPGRPLVLGGVRVPHSHGLDGHSDADVVLHAVTDAILGAAGLPDIGELFPNTDSAYQDADSGELLRIAAKRVAERGFGIAYLDIVIQAEAPKLSAHKSAMRARIAKLLDVDVDRVNVKAKTGEGVDAVGRGEAIAAMAIVGLRAL
jgi:2-C-methyl-D-erythritol 2,4-cyclodiphosphate synthase